MATRQTAKSFEREKRTEERIVTMNRILWKLLQTVERLDDAGFSNQLQMQIQRGNTGNPENLQSVA